MNDNSAFKFAMIGCGRVASKHYESLTELPGAHLIAVCDCEGQKAEKVGKKLGLPWYTDYHKMLRELPEIQIVNILTPSGYHARHTMDVASYGKHVVVEKPMALTISDAEAMIRACDTAGVKLFVVKQNRYNLPVQALRAALVEGRFGKIALGTVRVRWSRNQEYYNQDYWRGTWALDGGVLANQASHHIDLLTWLLGDIDSVFAYTATRLVDIEADDTAVAVLKFHSGALGLIEATTACRPTDLEGSISVLGEGGSVEIGGFAVNEIRTWNFVQSRDSDSAAHDGMKENPPNVYGFGHKRFLGSVLESLRSGKGGSVDGLEGLKSLVLINAMYESMETGKEVRLRFIPQQSRLGRKPDN